MEAEGLSIRAIAGLLRRRFVIVFGCLVAALAATGAALFAITPVYSSSALVIVDPVKRDLLERDDPYDTGWNSSRIDAEAELISSLSAFRTVAERLNLGEVPEFGGGDPGMRQQVLSALALAPSADITPEARRDRAARKLFDAIEVNRRELTNLIDVGASSQDPLLAADIANELAKVYVERQLEAKVQSVLAAQAIVAGRLSEASTHLASSERAFDEFVETSVERVARETGRGDLAALGAELETARSRRTVLDATLAQVRTGLAKRRWAAVAADLQSETLAERARQRESVVNQLAALPADSPSATELRLELQRQDELLIQATERSLAGLEEEIAGLQARTIEGSSRVRDLVLSSDLPPDVMASLYELQQASQIARAQYEALLTRQKDLENQAYLQLPDSRIASEAEASNAPSFPNPTAFLGLALVVGLTGGVAAAFLVENHLGGIASEEQVESVLRTMAIASIPRVKPLGRPNSGDPIPVADTLMSAPLSGFAESIRRMRIGLDQAIDRSVGQTEAERTAGVVIMVTSSIAGEGKTTVALALARAYALSGRSTLLVDCDLRKPGLHRQLGLEPSDGLIDYLSNRKHVGDFQSFVVEDPGSGAQIILGSRRSDIPTDQLVAGKTFSVLVAAARRNFDVVVLDAPPVGPVVDALYMVGLCDVAAYIIKWSDTPQQAIKRALESLRRVKPDRVQILAVVNQLDKVPVGYQGRYSEYYLES